jgi:hypothetical protein
MTEVDYPRTHAAGRAAALVRAAIAAAVERGGDATPAIEAQVQQALDLLRAGPRAGEALIRIEAISCTLARMQHARREGRVNAHASALLRLRNAAQRL